MRYASALALSALLAGCATGPMGETHAVGESTHAPQDVAQCIAQKWADSMQQQAMVRHTLANDKAFEIFVPGKPPGEAGVAVVRPAASGPGAWVGFRPEHGGEGETGPVTGVKACL